MLRRIVPGNSLPFAKLPDGLLKQDREYICDSLNVLVRRIAIVLTRIIPVEVIS